VADASVQSYDTIDVGPGTYTETNIDIEDAGKDLRIVGAGADVTILQAHADKHQGAGRIIIAGSISAASRRLVLTDMTLKNADTTGQGGAIFMPKGDLTVERCAFVDNRGAAGGAIWMQYENSNNDKGLTAVDCLFSGNTATNGTGAAVYAKLNPATIRNSTFSGNEASYNGWATGGAVKIDPSSGENVLIQNCTFVQNAMIDLGDANKNGAGAIGLGTSGNGTPYTTVESCVFSGNSDDDPARPLVYLMSGEGTVINCVGEEGLLAGCIDGLGNIETNAPGVDLTLADNGGPTMTHALLADSPAIDAGSNPAGLAYDQRGAPFERVKGAAADCGAYEFGAGVPKGTLILVR